MAIIPNDEKVIMVSGNVNTTYSGSKALKETAEWYTMEDVSNTVKPYKVYTALLTQGGRDEPLGDNGGTAAGNYPELKIGRTYYIADNFQLESDFTNVGAPNNNVGTYFVATGTTPASWGTYALLQYNIGAPVVTVLENTIGNIWFEYVGVGYYYVITDSSKTPFTIGKSMGFMGSSGDDVAGFSYGFLRQNDPDRFIILTQDFTNTDANGKLLNTPIEIRVYN